MPKMWERASARETYDDVVSQFIGLNQHNHQAGT